MTEGSPGNTVTPAYPVIVNPGPSPGIYCPKCLPFPGQWSGQGLEEWRSTLAFFRGRVCVIYSENHEPGNQHRIHIPILIPNFNFLFYLEVNKSTKLRVMAEGYTRPWKRAQLFCGLFVGTQEILFLPLPCLRSPPLSPPRVSFLAINPD